mgnify:CR=1 FL=1
MIDCENEIFNIVATETRAEYPNIYMIGEYLRPRSLVHLLLKWIVQPTETLSRVPKWKITLR